MVRLVLLILQPFGNLAVVNVYTLYRIRQVEQSAAQENENVPLHETPYK